MAVGIQESLRAPKGSKFRLMRESGNESLSGILGHIRRNLWVDINKAWNLKV